MTIFVTGASGLVGSAFVRAATRRKHRVVGTVGSFTRRIQGRVEKRTVDLTREGLTSGAVFEIFPGAIVNCAAVAAPEACEADPARSRTLNVSLPTRLAQLAHHLHVRLVPLSSEQVFSGAQTTRHRVDDVLSPFNDQLAELNVPPPARDWYRGLPA